MKSVKSLFTIGALLALAGCGGGGGGSSASNTETATSTTASTATFSLRSAYQALVGQNEVNSFTISGTCTGSATETRSAATAATFEGSPGVSTTTTLTGSYSNCTPASFAGTSVSYYDTNYKPVGGEGTDYAVYSTSNDLPTSVKVGDTAQFASVDVYSSSTKQVRNGTRVLSYTVEADSSSTAIVNLIAKGYNASNQLLYTQQSRYRINTSGQLTAVSKDIQYSTTSTSRMVWTKN